MQETLTSTKIYSFYYTKNKSKTKIVKITFIIIFCVLIIITFKSLFFNHKNEYISQEKYFLLSLANTTNSRNIESLQTKVEDVVGVSYVYQQGGVYHILGFIYNEETFNNDILKKVKNTFSQAQILLLSKNKLKVSVYREIKQDIVVKNFYEYQCKLTKYIYDLLKRAEGSRSLFEIYRELEKIKLKINQNIENLSLSKKTKIIECLKVSLLVNINQIKSCQNEISTGGNIIENLKLLYINTCFEDLSLRNSLNKL